MPSAYSPEDVLKNKDIFYEVCIDRMTMDGDEKAAEKLADWLGISLHALKCRWKRVFGYSINKIINYNCEDCKFPEVCERDCEETFNITKIEYEE